MDMTTDQFNRARGKHQKQPSELVEVIKAAKRRTPFKGRDNSKYGKRHKPGVMNKTEEAYSALLEQRKLTGEVIEWWFEAVTFKLADDCRYSPDFAVLMNDGSMEFIDAKGGGPIDPKSLVKIKCAAEKFHPFKFVIEQKLAKKLGGSWKRTEY
jgi:hypothetical protein